MIQGIHSHIVFVMPFYSFWGVQHSALYVKKQYASGEIEIVLEQDVCGQEVCILASAASADDVLELFVLLDVVKKSGARKITVCMPYLWYARLDKVQSIHSFGLEWFLEQLFFLGVHAIQTFDVHNLEFISYFMQQRLSSVSQIEHIISFSHDVLWSDLVASYVAQGFCLVFPDAGAYKRYNLYEKNVSCAWFEKQRQGDQIFLKELHGTPSKKVLLLDDILYSGKTLVLACQALQEMGVQEIIICVSHGFFIGDMWKDLFSLGVHAIYVSDSLPFGTRLAHPLIITRSLKNLFIKNEK